MTDQRVRTRIPAEWQAPGFSGRGEVRNVSHGGLFLGTQALPPEGATARVKLCPPGKVPVEVRGLVWWTVGKGAGIRPGFGLRILDDNEGYLRLIESVR